MYITFDIPIEEATKAFRPEKPLSMNELYDLIEHLQHCTAWDELIERALMFTVRLKTD